MSQRKRRRPRCEGCGLIPDLCACAEFPEVELQTPLVVVQHIREQFKPTNTARLLTRMAPGVQLVQYGMREPPFDETPLLRDDISFFVLYPREDAHTLSPDGGGLEVPEGKRIGFVVLDGTWHQCTRMTRRVPRVSDMPCVALPPGPPSIWGVRTQHDERGLCTFEASLRLLALMESPQVTAPMQRAFEIVTARMLFMKGKLRSPEVPQKWPAPDASL